MNANLFGEFFGFRPSTFFFLFYGIFFLIFVIFMIVLLKGLGQWNKNNRAPVLHVLASVVGKREDFSRRHSAGDRHMSGGYTRYYVTFEVESGDRMEFLVNGQEYGMLAERDYGTLKFQGTRFLGFERKY